MPELAAIENIIAVGNERTVKLSSSSLAVLFSALNNLENFAQWRGTLPNGELSTDERDRVDSYVSLATYELMVEAKTQMDYIGKVFFSITEQASESLLDISGGGSWLAEDYPELHAGLPDSMKDETTFTFPDMRARGLVGHSFNYTPNGGQTYSVQVGDIDGERTHKLTVSELPAHDHQQVSRDGTTGLNVIQSGGTNQTASYAAGGTNTQLKTKSAGGDAEHNNMPPFLAGYWYVVAKNA